MKKTRYKVLIAFLSVVCLLSLVFAALCVTEIIRFNWPSVGAILMGSFLSASLEFI